LFEEGLGNSSLGEKLSFGELEEELTREIPVPLMDGNITENNNRTTNNNNK